MIPWAPKYTKTGKIYGYKTIRIKGKQYTVYIHQIIAQRMGLILLPYQLHDHINRDTLNNKRNNIRAAWPSESIRNRDRSFDDMNKYKGVKKNGLNGHSARIVVNYEEKYLGTYLSEEMAARVYDYFAKLYHGKFAVLNFPNE